MTLVDDLETAARFGGAGTGVTRFAWSRELADVSDWLCERLRDLGLETEIDAAGNVFGRWQVGEGKAVLLGSHLDTVPDGGRYDGALGVLAALDAIRRLKASGIEPSRPVWLVSFMDEEGSRFRTGMLGSRAFVGEPLGDVGGRPDADGIMLRDAMAALGYDFGSLGAAAAIERVGAYLELHIEQGPRLESAGVDVGVVTGIVGLASYRVRFVGEANHAGTTPMETRRDALAGAARVVLALRAEALATEGMTANVGIIGVEPGGFNVIPGVCDFTVDVRAPGEDGWTRARAYVEQTVARIAAEERLEVELAETHQLDPVELDPALAATLERAAELEGASWMRLTSGAGHDAMILGRHVPSVMAFVPSRAGISHNPAEYTSPEACERGARVLGRALELLVAPEARRAAV